MREPGMAERLSALTPEQRALLELLRKKKAKATGQRSHLPPPVSRVSGPTAEGDWPLAFDQEWLLEVVESAPESNAYNVDAPTRLRGPLHFPALEAAFNEIVRRHAAWRTSFPLVDGRRVQRVVPHRDQTLLLVDLTAAPVERRERLAQLALLQVTQEPFDLENGPLVRAVFARLGPEEHACLITVHHLVTDWIAFHIFWSELAALYDAALKGLPSPLSELPVQYVDYAVWLRQWLQGEALEELAGYWRNKLSGFPLVLELPTDRPRQAQRRMKGGRYIVETGPEPADRLRGLAQREGATMFMATFAAVYALLYQFAGQEKMVLGSNNANRNRPEIEPIIGYFLIPVAFAVDLSGDPTFRELLGRVRATALEAYIYQDIPFAKLLEAVEPETRPGMPTLFQSLVLVLDGQYNKSRMEGVQGDVFFLYDAGARYDIMFGLYDTPMGIFGPVEYDYSLFDFSSIARLMGLFYRLLEAVGEDPDLRLSQLPTFASVERRQVLSGFQEGREGEVAPEVEQRASRLAGVLRRRGVRRGDRIGLLVEPAPEVTALALAAARLDAVPVPLDPGEPVFRLNPLLVDPDMVLLVHGGATDGDLRPTCPCVALGDLMEEAA
jgi:hypothetical protein